MKRSVQLLGRFVAEIWKERLTVGLDESIDSDSADGCVARWAGSYHDLMKVDPECGATGPVVLPHAPIVPELDANEALTPCHKGQGVRTCTLARVGRAGHVGEAVGGSGDRGGSGGGSCLLRGDRAHPCTCDGGIFIIG
jgi:hypothetical protein